MNYNDLTINQKISLKGEMINNPLLHNYKVAMKFYGFRKAIQYFLDGDINKLIG